MTKLLFVLVWQSPLLTQPGVAPASRSAEPASRRLADGGGDDHGTGSPHDRHPRTATQPRHPHGQALQPGRSQAERPRPVLADAAKADADELRATWGPFVAEAGTYELNRAISSRCDPSSRRTPR